ncbi:MAG: hypothetical protein ABIJ23_04055 [Candidatus Magasanikbacteria bacterium]
MEISCQRKFFGIFKKSREKIISGYVLFCLIVGILFPTTTSGSVPEQETLIFSPMQIEGTWNQTWNVAHRNINKDGKYYEFNDSNSAFPDVSRNYTRKELELEEAIIIEEEIIEEVVDEIQITTSTLDEFSTSTPTTTLPIATPSTKKEIKQEEEKTTTTTPAKVENETATSTRDKEPKEKPTKKELPTEPIATENITKPTSTPETQPREPEIVEPEPAPEPAPEVIAEPAPTSTEILSFWQKSLFWIESIFDIQKVLAQADGELPAPEPEPVPAEEPSIPEPSPETPVPEIIEQPAPVAEIFDGESEETISEEELTEILPEEEVEVTEEEEEEEIKPVKPDLNLVAKNFTSLGSNYYPQATAIKNARLGLSMTNKEAFDHKIIIYYKNNTTEHWKKLKTIKLLMDDFNYSHEGFFYYSLPNIKKIQDLQNIEIKIDYEGYSREPWQPIMIDGLWLETETDVPKITPVEDDIIRLASGKKDFNVNEDLMMIFSIDKEKIWKKNNKGLIKNIQKNLKNKEKELDKIEIGINSEILIIDNEGNTVNGIEVEFDAIEKDGLLIVSTNKNHRKLKPGKYQMEVKIYQEDYVIEYQQDFTWGVLAINTNKAVYSPGEEVYLQMAALDETGHTLCDADLSLIVTDPNDIESIVQIEKSMECGANNVTDVPDYFAYYYPLQSGNYSIKLVNNDTIQEINNYFKVEEGMPFGIERIGPTRIYPPATYDMIIKIDVDKDFTGQFKEIVPTNFIVKNIQINQLFGYFNSQNTPVFEITENVTETLITANVKWKQGDKYEIRYTFDAPNISPYLFLLGPIELSYVPQYQTISTTTLITTSTIVTTSTLDFLQDLNPGFDFSELMGVEFSFVQEIPIQKEVIIEPKANDFTDVFTEFRKWQIASDEVATINPNGNGTLGCTPTPGGSANYAVVADLIYYPTAGDTSDYVSCGLNSSDSYEMSTIGNVSSTTGIQVWGYYINGEVNDRFQVELWNSAETVQYGTTQELANSISNVWNSVTFSGLNLTQAQLDDMRIKYYAYKTQSPGTGSILYSTYATVTFDPANPAPVVSGVILNGGSDIIPIAGTTTTISASALITDNAGYGDIQNASAKIYRSGVAGAETCTPDNNNCYETISCELTNCAGNSCEAICPIDIWFHADPTDTGTPWAGEYWRAWIETEDSLMQADSGYSTVDAVNLQSMSGINLENSDINFGSLAPGEFTNPLTEFTKIISVGNTSLDIIVYGTDMVNTSSTIPVNNIVFATEADTSYSSSTPLLLTPGTEIEFDIPKNIDNFNFSSSTIWWGLKAPIPAIPGSYSSNLNYSSVVNELPW